MDPCRPAGQAAGLACFEGCRQPTSFHPSTSLCRGPPPTIKDGYTRVLRRPGRQHSKGVAGGRGKLRAAHAPPSWGAGRQRGRHHARIGARLFAASGPRFAETCPVTLRATLSASKSASDRPATAPGAAALCAPSVAPRVLPRAHVLAALAFALLRPSYPPPDVSLRKTGTRLQPRCTLACSPHLRPRGRRTPRCSPSALAPSLPSCATERHLWLALSRAEHNG